jgi:hypothetical protein
MTWTWSLCKESSAASAIDHNSEVIEKNGSDTTTSSPEEDSPQSVSDVQISSSEARETILSDKLAKKEALLNELAELTNEAIPVDVETKDTTLHIACQKHYSDDLIIDVLLAENSDATKVTNAQDELPLHSAMKDTKEYNQTQTDNNSADEKMRGVSEKVLEALLLSHKEAVEHLNINDCLPIHIACQNGAVSEMAINKLLKLYPTSVMMHCKITLPYGGTEISTNVLETSVSKDDELTFFNCEDSGLVTLFQQSLSLFLSPIMKVETPKDDDNNLDETDFSPLHLAILNNASPNVVDSILNTNPYCLNMQTSKGRTAMDIAKIMKDSADSIQVMESYDTNVRKSLGLATLSQSLLKAQPNNNNPLEKSLSAKNRWKKAGNAIIFTNRLSTSFGPTVDLDDGGSIKIPDDFEPPASLSHECLDVTLPVGFRQLRWALLNSQAMFNKDFHEGKLDCTE